jgi:hypothetical protein
MPLEYRLIHFRQAELEAALDRWLRANGEMDQYTRACNAKITETHKKVSIEVECRDSRSHKKGGVQKRMLDSEEVQQALVLFCKDRSIPLSQNGKKVVRLLDGMIAMYYALT